MAQSFSELANLIWSVAELLRSFHQQADHGKVILPLMLLRRFFRQLNIRLGWAGCRLTATYRE